MALYEKQKNARIMEEIYGYLLEKGFTKIQSHLEMKVTETVFTISVENSHDGFIKDFKDEMVCCRDTEMEEYGWDIHSSVECVCTLNTLGMLIDNYEIENNGKDITIVLHRKK